ncbi:MAG TPA: glycosyltransferase [Tenuifilaceae bacterium]|nr:glycosyltransferase [Tenuifilaceae bacterium]HPN22597.1 glycosyltransferase [Tenuifilaceae bacterium]
MHKISAVIITLNEEKNIERCLQSLVGVADEIVIVDSYSVDRTKEIAQNYGAKFIQHPFAGYRDQKNFAVQHASFDFVLSLDADEALSVDLKASILNAKQNWIYDAYEFNRLNYCCGSWIRHTAWYPDCKIRLFDRRKGEWSGANIHETIKMEKSATVGFLKGDLLHWTYTSYEQLVEMMNKYSTLSAKEYFRVGKKASFVKLVISPFWRFIHSYFIRGGFLDGYAGFFISVSIAKLNQLKYLKLYQLHQVAKSKVSLQNPMLVTSGIRLGFDAKRAFYNKSGLGNYSRNLIDSLVLLNNSNSIILFTPKTKKRIFLKSNTESSTSIVSPQRTYHRILPSLWRSRLIVRDVKKLKLDIYHGLSHELPFGIEESGAKTVVTVHDLIFLRYPEFYGKINVSIYKKKLVYACKVADRIVAISSQTKDDLINFLNVSPSKIDVIYQSCDVNFQKKFSEDELISVRQKYGLPEKYFLYVGTVEERKNLLNIVKALCEKHIELPLVVIGRKTKYFHNDVVPYIEQNNVKNIVFPSFVSNDDLPAVYQGALCFVYPSIFEGFGIPILEALTSGVPVITSKGSCFEETGGSHSLYVDPSSPEQIGDAIIRLIGDTNLRDLMVEKGYEHSKLFSPERIAEEFMRLYQDILSKNN